MKKVFSYSKNGHLTLESMGQATWYNNWTINIFKKYLKGEILEIGCGIGNFTKTLVSYGKVYSFDADKFCVYKTKQKTKNTVKVGDGNIETGHYFFKNRKFDTITCINVLEHIRDDNKALVNIINLLKPNGILILLIPAHPFLFGEIDRAIGHYRRYTKKRIINQLMTLGAKIVYGRRINFLGALGWFISSRILKDVSVSEKKLKLFDMIAPFVLPTELIIEPPLGTSILIIAKK